jgi:hypothetical protein
VVGCVVNANLHPEHLVHPFFARLHVTWQEFRLLVDLFNDAVENLPPGSTLTCAFWRRTREILFLNVYRTCI